MKNKSAAWLLLLIVLQAFTAPPSNAADKLVLMIPRQGSEDLTAALTQEAGVMIKMLEDSGYHVVVATVSGNPLATARASLVPDMKLQDANPADYLGIIMPCMNAGPTYVEPEAVAFIRRAAPLKIPIAAQRGSVLVLNEAGLRDWANDPQLKGDWLAKFGGKGVFQNGNLITSGVCPFYAMESGEPDGTRNLTKAFIECLNAKREVPQ